MFEHRKEIQQNARHLLRAGMYKTYRPEAVLKGVDCGRAHKHI